MEAPSLGECVDELVDAGFVGGVDSAADQIVALRRFCGPVFGARPPFGLELGRWDVADGL
jgi:hypothetical protein